MFKFIFLSLSCSLAHARALSVPAECQRLAWKAGHKRECTTVATWTARKRLWEKMKDLDAKQDWRGLAALEDEAHTAATQAPSARPVSAWSPEGMSIASTGA